jgi:hypothetical protein
MPLTLRGCSARTNWHSAGYYGLIAIEAVLDGCAKGLAKRANANAPKARLIADLAQTGRDLGTTYINSTLCPSSQFPEPTMMRTGRLYKASDLGLVSVD